MSSVVLHRTPPGRGLGAMGQDGDLGQDAPGTGAWSSGSGRGPGARRPRDGGLEQWARTGTWGKTPPRRGLGAVGQDFAGSGDATRERFAGK
jgi:hypothetical protein